MEKFLIILVACLCALISAKSIDISKNKISSREILSKMLEKDIDLKLSDLESTLTKRINSLEIDVRNMQKYQRNSMLKLMSEEKQKSLSQNNVREGFKEIDTKLKHYFVVLVITVILLCILLLIYDIFKSTNSNN